jgi:hypothetical protein
VSWRVNDIGSRLYDSCKQSVNAADARARVVQNGTEEEKKRVFSRTAKFFAGK